jgi:hypothetical protein
LNCCVEPAAMLGDAGVMATDVTVALLLTTPPPHPEKSATTASRRERKAPAETEHL